MQRPRNKKRVVELVGEDFRARNSVAPDRPGWIKALLFRAPSEYAREGWLTTGEAVQLVLDILAMPGARDAHLGLAELAVASSELGEVAPDKHLAQDETRPMLLWKVEL